MFYIVCYDTPSDKRRRKLANLLKNHIMHVQKSVFEGYLTKEQFEKLLMLIEKNIDEKEDSVRIYEIPKDMVIRTKVFGYPPLTKEEPTFYMI